MSKKLKMGIGNLFPIFLFSHRSLAARRLSKTEAGWRRRRRGCQAITPAITRMMFPSTCGIRFARGSISASATKATRLRTTTTGEKSPLSLFPLKMMPKRMLIFAHFAYDD
jgi:hypothetical protein